MSGIVALVIALTQVQSDQFAFRSGFRNNLHHFLYVLGRDRNGTPDRTREAVITRTLAAASNNADLATLSGTAGASCR